MVANPNNHKCQGAIPTQRTAKGTFAAKGIFLRKAHNALKLDFLQINFFNKERSCLRNQIFFVYLHFKNINLR